MNKTWIIAHRGASAYAPENTLPAFAKALEMGADGIELDVQLSKDGELVVIHDEQVNRTSNGYGYVIDHTLKELKQLDFGKWYHKRFTSAKIPTLQEVIELLKGWNGLLNIELKNSFIKYPEIEEKLLQYLYSYDMENQVIISSFNHYSLKKIKALNPNLKIGLLYESILVDPWSYAKHMKAYALHPHFYSLILYPELIKGCKENGIALNPYTVDDVALMRVLIQAGVDGLITNKPDIALGVRRSLVND